MELRAQHAGTCERELRGKGAGLLVPGHSISGVFIETNAGGRNILRFRRNAIPCPALVSIRYVLILCLFMTFALHCDTRTNDMARALQAPPFDLCPCSEVRRFRRVACHPFGRHTHHVFRIACGWAKRPRCSGEAPSHLPRTIRLLLCLSLSCSFAFEYFMVLIDVYVTGWGGGKSWPRAEGPGAGSRRLTAAFFSSPRSPARRSPLGSPANTLEICSHGLTRCRISCANRNRMVRWTLVPRHNESISVK